MGRDLEISDLFRQNLVCVPPLQTIFFSIKHLTSKFFLTFATTVQITDWRGLLKRNTKNSKKFVPKLLADTGKLDITIFDSWTRQRRSADEVAVGPQPQPRARCERWPRPADDPAPLDSWRRLVPGPPPSSKLPGLSGVPLLR